MKKKTLALLGFTVLAGVALASCGKKKENADNNNNGGGQEGSSSDKAVWNPMSYNDAKSAYNIEAGKNVDAWVVYSEKYGTTYNVNVNNPTNPIDNITYKAGDTLPAWKAFASNLGISAISQAGKYGNNDKNNHTAFTGAKTDDGVYIGTQNGEITDLYYNKTDYLNELGDDDQLIDLTSYIDGGKMPAFAKFLEDNPSVRTELTHDGKIFYTPYLDGFQAVERNYMMDTKQVEKLLDDQLPAGTGNLLAGASAGSDSKGLKGSTKVVPFINADNNYASDTEIDIVNPKNETKVTVTVKKTTNIINRQNTMLNKTDSSVTGKDLIDDFKAYAREAYGDIIDNYYDGKISKMFTSVGACYNADDLIALLRIFKANPDVLYGSADVYDEVIPVFPRGVDNSRIDNILNFGATLYGVQGRGSEYDKLFFGADGKIHDGDTITAAYDMLDKLHALYSEQLIQQTFWSGSVKTYGFDNFFAKKGANISTYGLLEYDYIATQAASNDLYQGIGTKTSSRGTSASGFDFKDEQIKGINAILSPLTYVSTESFDAFQSLDNKAGKTLTRYYEENRSVKNTSWSIPKGSDNIDGAIALMDYMFTKEGWEIQNFGPTGYWDYGTVLGEENTPVIKQTVLNHFVDSGQDFWNYCRCFVGSTQGIGHYRPTTLDYQATNFYARDSYTNLTLACDLGVQFNSRAVGTVADVTWHASMPMAVFSTMDKTISDNYAGLTKFWANDKATSSGTKDGWIKVVADGNDATAEVVASASDGKAYTYAQVKAQIEYKNLNYLYAMGNKMKLIAPEAMED